MINTTLCYIRRGEDYLMLHRVKKKNDLNQDKWIGIGGKFEDKESPEDCLLREVWEETGLKLEAWQFRGIVTFVSDRLPTEYMHLFTATRWENSPAAIRLAAADKRARGRESQALNASAASAESRISPIKREENTSYCFARRVNRSPTSRQFSK